MVGVGCSAVSVAYDMEIVVKAPYVILLHVVSTTCAPVLCPKQTAISDLIFGLLIAPGVIYSRVLWLVRAQDVNIQEG